MAVRHAALCWGIWSLNFSSLALDKGAEGDVHPAHFEQKAQDLEQSLLPRRDLEDLNGDPTRGELALRWQGARVMNASLSF
jgi:hypothetical protein